MFLSVIVLAAGRGTRMNSALPKVMQPVGGRPMLEHIVDAANNLEVAQKIAVVGFGKEYIIEHFRTKHSNLEFAVQYNQLGTGDALKAAIPTLAQESEYVLVLNGDVPLMQAKTLQKLIDSACSGVSLLTIRQQNPTGLGRIVRAKDNKVLKIVEEKDATDSEKQITEINPGIYLFNTKFLKANITKINNNNAQQEYYITDLIKLALDNNYEVQSLEIQNSAELLGVNTKQELAMVEMVYQNLQITNLQQQGVTTISPATLSIRGNVTAGMDVVIDQNVILEQTVELGDNVTIGANCIIKNSNIASNTKIEPNSIIEDAIIGEGCTIGPFARIRPGTQLLDGAKVGNFVETKKAVIGKNSKANHLSYLGDVEIGCNVNIGAGVITCNYDGVNKYKTIIEDNVFVGSDSQLVAPVTITKNATIAAGTTVMKNVEKSALILNKKTQDVVDNWQRPNKGPLCAE